MIYSVRSEKRKEELKEICGIDKEYSHFSKEEKYILFGKMNPVLLGELIVRVDASKRNKKKD